MKKVIDVKGIHPKGMILCRIKDLNGIRNVYIRPISQEEEDRIDKSSIYYGNIRYEREDEIIAANQIYLYGEVNFNNQEDIDVLDAFNLIDYFGSYVYDRFNYDTGTVTTDKTEIIKRVLTSDCIARFKFCHCLIGKPERVIVYKAKKKCKYESC